VKPWQRAFLIKSLQISRSTKQVMHSEVVMRPLQPIMFIHRQNNSSYSILPCSKQNCQTTCLYVTAVFAILWSQGGVGFEFFHDLRTGPSPRGAFGGHAPANFLRSPPNDL